MSEGLDTLGQVKGTLLDLAIRFGPKVLAAVLILAVGIVISNWVARTTAGWLKKLALEPPVRQLLTRLARVLVLLLFAVLALQNLGVELLPLIAGLGVAGAGIALATQGVLSNMVAGLTIIFTKPYRVGEYVAVVGVEGQVDTITLFSTVLTHPDRSRIFVPNRKVVGEILQNFGQIRQAEIQVGIAYGSDLPRALGAIGEVVRANPRVLSEPAPLVQLAALADFAMQISIRPWVAVPDYRLVAGELYVALVDALQLRGIDIPLPQQEVRLLAGGPQSPA